MKKICFNCKHFILKLMMNGYNGMCDAKPLWSGSFVCFNDTCDDWERKGGE